ncbi:YncE family protein [Hyalangium sp.]|uniref:YncE family protein n=1 Tax=Hyalangium sp. TaxID=2028555 RepID=UPI002D3D4EEC|nr:YncE family protein [Hyalangium sp.]HYI02672.1 YncE family protein [Hyalangium sp.]
MKRRLLWPALLAVGGLLTGCPDDGPPDDPPDAGPEIKAILSRPSRSTAIDITEDDSRVAAVNPDTGSMTLITTATKARFAVVNFEATSMPSSVAFHPDGKTAFVTLRKKQTLAKVNATDTLSPQVASEVAVGSEPTGVALSPTGKYAVVANFGETTVFIVNTETMQVESKVDVGGNPRALTISNDGDMDDADERAYVTLFYGDPISEASDDGRRGKVVELEFVGNARVGRTFALAPLDTGIGVPQAGGGSGPPVQCSPNQLFGIVLNTNRLYVTHACASPKGPVNAVTNLFAGVSVIDLASGTEDRGVTGSVALANLINTQGNNNAASSLLGVPIAMDFVRTARVGYVLSQSGDVVQRVVYNPDDTGQPIRLGLGTGFAQINLRGDSVTKVPIGIVVAHTQQVAYVNNWVDRSVSVLDLNAQAVSGTPIPTADKPAAGSAEARVLNGKKFFFTGTGRWALQAVNSCGSCHPDGLSDNLTWVFAAGPRQSTPLDGTFAKKDPTDQRVLNWTAIFDEMHDFELNTRGTAGGKGAITTKDAADPTKDDLRIDLAAGLTLPGHTALTRNDFLSGSTKEVVRTVAKLADWDELEDYTKTIPANRAPSNLDAAAVARGRAVFEQANCHMCHGGAKWTVSRLGYTPSPEKNGTATATGITTPTGLRTEAFSLRLPAPLTGTNNESVKVDIERLAGSVNVGPERIACAVRAVGTFDVASPLEKKADNTQAQGAKGFNPPSLLGMATSAPYLHHGEAKTLLDLFAPKYAAHHQAAAANFLVGLPGSAEDVAKRADLVAFLLSIDDSTPTFAIPAGADICAGY